MIHAICRRVALFSLVLLVFSESAEAKVERYCRVSYETQVGWSDEHLDEVTFVTGYELNQATKKFSFDGYAKYALVWFAKDEVAINEIDTFAITGLEVTPDGFKNMFLVGRAVKGDQVNSDGDRHWRIHAKELIQFIDPRAR
jgi:hypothetical protein